jgi:hypothetical protein
VSAGQGQRGAASRTLRTVHRLVSGAGPDPTVHATCKVGLCPHGLEMIQYLVDDRLILDIGYHLSFAFALWADRYIDVINPAP